MSIRKSGNSYKVVSKKGKSLGTYKTRAAANKRLRQVEYHKAKPRQVAARTGVKG
tara:strand:+ start:152 stop:316 length:165 start_codon:yes stop_codon:yes gene_type:complete